MVTRFISYAFFFTALSGVFFVSAPAMAQQDLRSAVSKVSNQQPVQVKGAESITHDFARGSTKAALTNVKKIYDGSRSYYEEEFPTESGGENQADSIKTKSLAARSGIIPRNVKCTGISAQQRQDCLHAIGASEIDEPRTLQQASDHKDQLESMQSNVMKKASDTQNGIAGNLK